MTIDQFLEHHLRHGTLEVPLPGGRMVTAGDGSGPAAAQANRDAAAELHDERFCRMWEFYLSGADVSFRHGGHMNFQPPLARRPGALPTTRDYIGDAERNLARLDRRVA